MKETCKLFLPKVPVELRQALKISAVKREMTLQALINDIFTQYINRLALLQAGRAASEAGDDPQR